MFSIGAVGLTRVIQNYVCVPSVIRVECQYERCLGAGQNSWNTGCLCIWRIYCSTYPKIIYVYINLVNKSAH